MAPSTLEVTIQAAEDLKDLALYGKMNVYAVAWVDPYAKKTTQIRRKGGKNPVWNEGVSLPLETVRHFMNALLNVQIFSEASMGDKVVGTARLSLQEIYGLAERAGDDPVLVTLALQRPSGRAQGTVSLHLQVTGDYRPSAPSVPSAPAGQARQSTRQRTSDKADDLEPVLGIPVTPYPGPMYYSNYAVGSTSAGLPSLASQGTHETASSSAIVPYAHPYPQNPNYQGYYGSYPTPQAPYLYHQSPRQQSRSSGSILLGLLGGAIGGLILGDILS